MPRNEPLTINNTPGLRLAVAMSISYSKTRHEELVGEKERWFAEHPDATEEGFYAIACNEAIEIADDTSKRLEKLLKEMN